MFKVFLSMVLVASFMLTGCSKNSNSNYPHHGYTYNPYNSYYYTQSRYYNYRSHRRPVHCVYDNNMQSYVLRKYQNSHYNNISCTQVNNFITNYNSYGFYPYYITSGCPLGYSQVYYGYSLVCAPANYYNRWYSYINTNPYLSFFNWWLGFGIYLRL